MSHIFPRFSSHCTDLRKWGRKVFLIPEDFYKTNSVVITMYFYVLPDRPRGAMLNYIIMPPCSSRGRLGQDPSNT